MPSKFMTAMGWGALNPAELNFQAIKYPESKRGDAIDVGEAKGSLTPALVAAGDEMRRMRKAGWICKEISCGHHVCERFTEADKEETDAQGVKTISKVKTLIETVIVTVNHLPAPPKPVKEPKPKKEKVVKEPKAKKTKDASGAPTAAVADQAEVEIEVAGEDEDE